MGSSIVVAVVVVVSSLCQWLTFSLSFPQNCGIANLTKACCFVANVELRAHELAHTRAYAYTYVCASTHSHCVTQPCIICNLVNFPSSSFNIPNEKKSKKKK